MTDSSEYRLVVTRTARRQLAESLPEAVATAAFELITGVLLHEPIRVGKQLRPPFVGSYSALRGTYRTVYRVDDELRTVTVIDVAHRRDAYRT